MKVAILEKIYFRLRRQISCPINKTLEIKFYNSINSKNLVYKIFLYITWIHIKRQQFISKIIFLWTMALSTKPSYPDLIIILTAQNLDMATEFWLYYFHIYKFWYIKYNILAVNNIEDPTAAKPTYMECLINFLPHQMLIEIKFTWPFGTTWKQSS